MKTLFTIFELFVLIGRVFGIAVGCLIGYLVFDIFGLVGGGILGLLIGGYLGKLPGNRSIVAAHLSFKDKTNEDLRAELHQPDCELPNYILLELNYRGADIISEFPIVLDLLEDPDPGKRRKGVAAITSVFPELANQVPGYRPTDTVDECKRKARILRDKMKRKDS
jgi:hypothetical protein